MISHCTRNNKSLNKAFRYGSGAGVLSRRNPKNGFIITALILFFLLPIPKGRSTDQAKWSWNQPNAIIKDTGDLEWAPKAFAFKKNLSPIHIDYENGNDDNAGTRTFPFKHHPWDDNATGRAAACEGIHTYVFKRGVVYRGILKATESGTANEPIRLTSDPSWSVVDPTFSFAKNAAVIAGSKQVLNWKNGAVNAKIPYPEKVWWSDLDFKPRNIWMVAKSGYVTRIPLARTPNWRVTDQDDVKSEWFHWDNPGKTFGYRNGTFLKAFDSKNIDKPSGYYKNAILWTEWGWVMGTPFPTRIQSVDLKERSLSFKGQWGGPNGQIIRNNRYFLEDKPQYLDDPKGEFWFERKGKNKGRLYIRLPGDIDPNTVDIEAGKFYNLIDSTKTSHLNISGLTFLFTNTFWDLTAGPWVSKDIDPACVRLIGSGKDITVSNCVFEHVNMAVRVKSIAISDVIDDFRITDCVVRNSDHGAFLLEDGGGWGKKDERIGRLLNVELKRNKLINIGMRPNRFGQGHALVVDSAQTLEISGNILDRCYGSGIHVFGSKRSELAADRPLSRILIHHNKVTNPMLNTNDWGGIETWQGGPAYVYDNISGNPGGYWNWKFKNNPKESGCGRFGHAYYLDGAFKNYYFNNIAWGKSKDPYSRLGNTSAFQEIHSYQNTFFNNTVYNFVIGSRRQAAHAGRDKFLSNIWDSIGDRVFRHASPAKSAAEANAKDAGRQKKHFAYETNAYSANIFHDIARYGVFEANGRWLKNLDDFKNALQKQNSLLYDLGRQIPETALRNPAKHDFRLRENSPAIDKGSKVFVPWSLFAMVGEWNFYHAGNDPTRIMDEHWYMAPYYTARDEYASKPMFPLKGVGITIANYVEGPLEDWIKGALQLNGKNQFAVLSDKKLNKVQEIVKKSPLSPKVVALRSPQIRESSFLIEVYFKTIRNQSDAVVVEKMNGNGYSLTLDHAGELLFKVKGATGEASLMASKRINDGEWHHVIAECDRESAKLALYIDGKKDSENSGIGQNVNLSNTGDMFVGGTPNGRCIEGVFDFLRISLGTLKDAKTTIEELYAWEFNGPFLRDFTGRLPKGKRRDAGALEYHK